jgi:hypothetical protein
MRIKLLKKMYRQTNEAIKRGDVFQQRPCPFYNEMHRIFAGTDDPNGSILLPNAQSLLNEEDTEEEGDVMGEDDEMNNTEGESENEVHSELSTADKISQAINRLIEYQKQNEVQI